MGSQDFQLTAANESTYGTLVARSRAWEYDSESIEDDHRRTEGDPLRVGSWGFQRNDRFTPYYGGAAGTVTMGVLSKGFGFWLVHMLGASATTGPAETTAYTHTGTPGELAGDSFCMQVNRPFHPAGTNQAFTYGGCKIPSWTLSNSAEDRLMLELSIDAMSCSTGVALDTPTYPTAMDELTWAGGLVTIGGSTVALDEFSLEVNNNMNVDRRKIRQNTDKMEPTAGAREASFSLSCDFESLTQRNRAAATSRAGAMAAIVATWRGPTLLGSTIYPNLTVTIPAARFDEWAGSVEGRDGITQELSGVARWDGTNPTLTVAYQSADTTA